GRARGAPGEAPDHGVDARERDHGGPAPRSRDLGRSVPSGIDPHDVRQGSAAEFPEARAGSDSDDEAMIRTLLRRLERGEPLDRQEVTSAVRVMMHGEAADEDIRAFLLALAKR